MRSIVGAIERGEVAAEVCLVLSNKRSAPGLQWAHSKGLPTAFVDHRRRTREAFEREIDGLLREAEAELVVLAGFMRILSGYLVQRWRIVNIHPSLLPAFPGMHAQRQAIEARATVSGCTVHFVDEGTDTGPIIAQAEVRVTEEDSEETLSSRILVEENHLFPKAIQMIVEGQVG